MNEFEQYRQRQMRGISVTDVLTIATEHTEGLTDVVMLTVDKDGQLTLYYSYDNGVEIIGALELAKQMVYEDM